MMSKRASSIVVPVLVLTLGVGWLLTVVNADPRIPWVPVLGMAVVGLLTLFVGGLDKATAVAGPFLLICTGFALARQTGHIRLEVMVPCLVIALGMLMLASHWLPLRHP